MKKKSLQTTRRQFMATSAAAFSAYLAVPRSAFTAQKRNMKLGFDNFSVRAMGWKAPQLIEYAESLNVDVLLLSDLEVYESLEEDYLKKIKSQADEAGIELQAGTGSICPTSQSFNDKHGSAVEHLSLLLRVAHTLGSPVGRCYLGSGRDRANGEIYRHIEETVKVCKECKSLAEDLGVTIAIENHAGDMQAWELKELIEAAGKSYVGALIDPGNATWTIEAPMVNLEILGPYCVTTGMRDSHIWESEKGAYVNWSNMGDGVTDWEAYMKRFEELCAGVPFILEIITGVYPRPLNYYENSFWEAFPRAKAHEFVQFIKLARDGEPFEPSPDRPSGEDSRELTQAQQKYDLETSLRYCREELGLGLK